MDNQLVPTHIQLNEAGSITVKKSVNVDYLVTLMSDLQNKYNAEKALESIKRTLYREFGIECLDIKICDNTSGKFFGMYVIPADINGLVSRLYDVDNKFSPEPVKKFYLEIDSMLLYDKRINATPREMVAVLLHEVGHLTLSVDVQQRLRKTIILHLTKIGSLGVFFFKMFRNLQTILAIAVLNAFCSFTINYINNNSEKDADRMVMMYGFGADLNSLLAKLVGQGILATKDVRSYDEIEKDEEIMVKWSIESVASFESRRKEVARQLEVEYKNATGSYVKAIIKDALNTASDKHPKDIIKTSMLKSTIRESHTYEDIADMMLLEEGFFADIMGFKKKTITQEDIDELSINIDMIKVDADRLHLISEIHKKIMIANSAKASLEATVKANPMDSQAKNDIQLMEDYINQLNKLRDKVVANKIVDKQYGVFLKYPTGY